MQELFELASAFENSVVPQEYGTDRDDKRRIGSKMCKALLEKIKYDLTITMASPIHLINEMDEVISSTLYLPNRTEQISLFWTLFLSCFQDEHLSDLGYHLDHSHAEDIGINSLGRCVRTRLYFTSESHLHTLLNVLRFPR